MGVKFEKRIYGVRQLAAAFEREASFAQIKRRQAAALHI
jgi:hypothetical protein